MAIRPFAGPRWRETCCARRVPSPVVPPRFPPASDPILRLAALVVLLGAAAAGVLVFRYDRSPLYSPASLAPEQPVPFSHAHHVGMIGLDCRYCHHSVTESAFAGVPETEVCMSCHAHLFTEAPVLEPVRESWRTHRPIAWQRVHDLPDHVYFDHSAHVTNGVACISCHGRVDRMPLVRKAGRLTMQWCLACHRDPAPMLSPQEAIFSMSPTSPAVLALVVDPPDNAAGDFSAGIAASEAKGTSPAKTTPSSGELMALYGIDASPLRDCTTCHR